MGPIQPSKSGVQKRFLDINPLAFFDPCGCHILNLVLSDMAKSSNNGMALFGTLHQIYILFSASMQRWQIFKKYVKNLTYPKLDGNVVLTVTQAIKKLYISSQDTRAVDPKAKYRIQFFNVVMDQAITSLTENSER